MEKEIPDFTVSRLGDCGTPVTDVPFVHDDEHVLYHSRIERIREFLDAGKEPPRMELAGPRAHMIRSMPSNARDSVFCLLLGQYAVHAGMTGRTGMIVGVWRGEFTHVPILAAISRRKRISPEGWLWAAVLSSTCQPGRM